MSIRFLTYFPGAGNMVLVKDVGQIPYTLSKKYDYKSSIASFGIDQEGLYAKEMLPYLNFLIIERRYRKKIFDEIIFIKRNAKNYDWVNLYHSDKITLLRSVMFKLVNPKIKIYLKLDADFDFCRELSKSIKKQLTFKVLSMLSNLVSVESKRVRDKLEKYCSKKIILIPNGSNLSGDCDGLTKENYFLTVGRLGTKQKATEIILESFALSADKHDFNLFLVGKVEESFESYIKDYFHKHKNLVDRVVFFGEVSDRGKLRNLYQKSKCFVLPSRWEGFALVLTEAVCCGCYILCTPNVPSFEIITNNGMYGEAIECDNIFLWANALERTAKKTFNQEDYLKISRYGNSQFNWSKISEKLSKYIERIEYENSNIF